MLIDTHGWYRQTIVSGGENGPVYRAFDRYFPYNRYSSLSGGSGYFASWAAYVVGYDACLFEFPDVSSTLFVIGGLFAEPFRQERGIFAIGMYPVCATVLTQIPLRILI